MEPEPAPQPLGARVRAEIGRLESLLVRVGAEFSDEEGDDETSVGDRWTGAGQAEPLSIPNVFAHSTKPRPCTPLGSQSRRVAVLVLPTKPRTPQVDNQVDKGTTEGGSPRQRVANVYTRAAAAVSADCAETTQPRGASECDDATFEAVLSRNIAEAREALGQLERYAHCSFAACAPPAAHRCLILASCLACRWMCAGKRNETSAPDECCAELGRVDWGTQAREHTLPL
jgi:hypothetical protein